MIYFYDAVAFRFVADTSQCTAIAVGCLVRADGLRKSCFGFALMCSNVLHLLSHRAVVAILFFIVKKRIGFEGMLLICLAALVFIKIIILHIAFNIVLSEILIVLL